MDSAITAFELNRIASPSAVAAQVPADDDLAFFQALWFWIPAVLALWSVLIWGVTRVL
jgi:hypothetical protein